MRALDPVAITGHGILHPQRGVARPYGVVLVGQRRAEQCHDAIPYHLVHRPLIPVHGLHHVLKGRVKELARFLGITVGE
jgi:hypothetical protein